MFDTHCHLNFKTFKNNVDEVVKAAQEVGVAYFVVPGTDEMTSQRAVLLTNQFEHIFAACGVHPHHVFEILEKNNTLDHEMVDASLKFLKPLFENPKVVAVGEIGLDKHDYLKTKYEQYHTNDDFIKAQQLFLIAQIKLAKQHNKSVMLHNRAATDECLEIINNYWDPFFSNRVVFHCCEPSALLLSFAKDHDVFIGVDGDVTYDKAKQDFIKEVPLERLVVETDAPFILPEPLKSQKKYPNVPANLLLIVEAIARLKKESTKKIAQITTENGKKLFKII